MMRRYRPQYNLATTFVVLTIVAVVSSWLAGRLRERNIVALIEDRGGFVLYDTHRDIITTKGSEATVIQKATSAALGSRITFVSLRGSSMRAQDFSVLVNLTDLEQLDLSGAEVNICAATELAKLTCLRTLYLNDALISDSLIADLRRRLPNTVIIGPSRFRLNDTGEVSRDSNSQQDTSLSGAQAWHPRHHHLGKVRVLRD